MAVEAGIRIVESDHAEIFRNKPAFGLGSLHKWQHVGIAGRQDGRGALGPRKVAVHTGFCQLRQVVGISADPCMYCTQASSTFIPAAAIARR